VSEKEKLSPSGIKVTPEAKAEERKALNLNPSDEGATKIRKELKIGAVAIGTIVLLAIVLGVLKHSSANAAKGKAAEAVKPVQTAGSVGSQGVDELQHQAARHRAELAAANGGLDKDGLPVEGGASSGIPNGDPAGELGLPPTRIAQGGGPGGANGGPRQPTKAELRAAEAEAEDKAARNSSLSTKGGMTAGQSASPGAVGPMDTLNRTLQDRLGALAGAAQGTGGGAGGAGVSGADDQNQQGDKAAFLAKSHQQSEANFQTVSRVQPLTNYEIKAGWDIPATLEQAMNSDLPGDVRGIVRENVYDTATGKYLLIPQGSRVIGMYNSRVAYGQGSVQVVWTRLIYPDGSSIELGGLNGQDVRGLSGFRDKVDNHYVRLFGFALMTSAFAAGIELTQNQSNTGFVITPQQAATQAVGQQLGQLGMEITRRNLNIQPTVKISIGYRFTIRVRKDLVFDRPYGAERAIWK
jgi:type IV secretion system protein TrbI